MAIQNALAIMALPIFDTTLVTVLRALRGRPVAQGGADHVSHRLVALGLSERQAVLALYAVSALAGCLAADGWLVIADPLPADMTPIEHALARRRLFLAAGLEPYREPPPRGH